MPTRMTAHSSKHSGIHASGKTSFKLNPLAHAVALLLFAGSAQAQAQQAFSPGWFANKGAVQGTVSSTGQLPNGLPASALGPQRQSQAARDKLQQSLGNLNTAAQAIALQQALQKNARAAASARAGGVPDGLGEGGLKVDEDALTQGWLNAKGPTQTVAGGQTTVNIQQTGDKAVLNWETFNVGKHTTVDFDQQSHWAVLNRINDPRARPSQIQGQIHGEGTVLIVNRNGVMFSGSSQVNVRNLVAAAAQMSDTQFMERGLYSTQEGGVDLPSFTDAAGAVIVEAGAQITTAAPGSVLQGGGYALLLGHEVHNAGEITTTKGQTQLAAGDSFIIRKGVGTDANTFSTTRGNEIAPQFQADSTAGQVSNTGLILAREGDITLAGRDVRQDGVAVATTTVDQRGTIHLLNAASDSQGQVTLGANAVTAVLIEDDGKTTALDSQRQALIDESKKQDTARALGASATFDNLSKLSDRRDLSRVEIVSGGDVNFEGQSLTLATGGQIAVSATDRTFVADRAQLDVSGAVGVNVAMESNNVLINVQGNELRDSPLNRDSGNLFNSNVWIDRRHLIYVPAGTGGYAGERWYAAGGLLEVGGYLSNQGHGIGEWAAQGGSVTLGGHEVIAQQGSAINLAGGTLDVRTGNVHQTWLKGSDGRLYNLNDAPANMTYDGVYQGFEDTHARWGANATGYYYNPLIAPQQRLESGYTVGRDAGTLTISAPTAVLEGDINASVFNGERQSRVRDGIGDSYRQSQTAVAKAGTLGIYRVDSYGPAGAFDSRIAIDDVDAITGAWTGSGDALPEDRIGTVLMDAEELNRTGLGGLTIATAGDVTIGQALTLADGGHLDLSSPQVAINADVTARSGEITIDNAASQDAPGAPPPPLLRDDGSADFTLGEGATIDLRGVWTNGALDGNKNASTAYIDGGDFTARMIYGSVSLEAGSAIDVSSGATLFADNSVAGGRGGDVNLIAGASVNEGNTLPNPGGVRLKLDGDIRAQGVAGGGVLTLQSPNTVVFGEDATLAGGVLAPGTSAPTGVILAEDVTLGPGSLLPITFGIQLTATYQDVPLRTSMQLPFDQAPIVTAAEWVLPTGLQVLLADGSNLAPGAVIPAGTQINLIVDEFSNYQLPKGLVVPSAVFPQGIPVTPFQFVQQAGEITPIAVTYKAGQLVERGVRFEQQIAFEPALRIDAGVFHSGFSDYQVTSLAGLQVSEGAQLRPEVPVFRLASGGLLAATGADPLAALESWTPPIYQEDATAGHMSQREGAGLVLRGTDLSVATDAGIEVDPGEHVRLAAAGQITVDGSIVAPGGDVAIVSESVGQQTADLTGKAAGTSLWIGEHALLDVAGRAHIALDQNGRRYGIVQDGGSIRIGLEDYDRVDKDLLGATYANVVIREGARLDASGAAADIDLYAGQDLFQPSQVVRQAGDGGLIRLGSMRGIYNDGDLRAAAGGEGAAGGTLNLVLENVKGSDIGVRVLNIAQDRADSGLANGLQAGVDDPSLARNEARISVEEIEVGGFGTLDLWSRDVFSFEGDVDLAMTEGLFLRRGVLSVAATASDAHISLAAPYVLLEGKVDEVGGGNEGNPAGLVASIGNNYSNLDSSAQNTGALAIDADLIDVRDHVYFGASGLFYPAIPDPANSPPPTPIDANGFDTVQLTSRGDMRFTDGRLATGGDMTLTAAQIYPTTHATGTVDVGRLSTGIGNFDPDRTLTIRGQGSTPAAPLSVFGSLTLTAPNIDQGGIVRAPLGRIVLGLTPNNNISYLADKIFNVTLRDGSVTSTSAAGLTMPYGGTSDGLRYLYNGEEVTFVDLADLAIKNDGGVPLESIESGIAMGQVVLTAEQGALLDVSGGGELTGAGFFTGRGGSVDVLRTSLFNANPTNLFSSADAQVFAIVPGHPSAYAPVAPDSGAGASMIGQQITLTEAVGELPAGTYTLMPSTYALLPGAYRIELGGQSLASHAAVDTPAGSFSANGYLGIANTDVRDMAPTAVTLTPGAVVRSYSQYNETHYADFAITNAATFGGLRPRLERDAQSIQLDFGQGLGEPLDFEGEANMNAAEGGVSGNLFLSATHDMEIKSSDAEASEGFVGLDAEDLSSFHAGSLTVGGIFTLIQAESRTGGGLLGPRVVFTSKLRDVVVRDGAALHAGQIFLTGQDVTVESGAVLDTTAGLSDGINSTLGYIFSDSRDDQSANGGAVLTVANGFIDFTPPLKDDTRPNSITVEDGAALRTLGTIGFATSGAVSLGEAELSARYLALAVPDINIGTAESFAVAEAAGVLGSGVRMSQSTLEKLLNPTKPGLISIERINLTVGESINLFGDVDFNLRTAGGDTSAMLVLNSPAIYGWGDAGDVARITTDTLIWNGLSSGAGTSLNPFVSRDPGAVTAGGAGTGSGTLAIDARQIVFGYDSLARPQDQVELDRLALGFSNVHLNASERITANNRGTLAVYQSGTDEASYAGGTLRLNAPLLTGDAGSYMAYKSGGALAVSAPEGAAPVNPSTVNELGAEVRLAGQSVTVDTTVALPSGRLVLESEDGIALTDRADIDLSGRAVQFFDVTQHSWGGDLVMEAATGAIAQSAGAIIDVSASHNDAGTITATATGATGRVDLDGALFGSASAGFDSGAIDIRAMILDDFAGLNEKLNTAGFFDTRRFVIKTGDLTVGNEVRANQVTISVDGGSLTVDGRIDASGEDVGTIRLAARDDLTLTGNAVLDAHGTRLVADAYGQAIEASNRGEVELTTSAGTIDLASGGRIDLRSADGIARGRLEINAPRIGGDDVAVNAAGGLVIDGADSIAINAFAGYSPADGVVNQAYLDVIHADSTAFVDAANANGAVDARLSGLKSYGDAFHLRPGVDITSATPDGDLTVQGDLDLSGYRYGPTIDGAIRGSGEPGVINIRAGGDLTVNGSINDGFAPPPATPDDYGWFTNHNILRGGVAVQEDVTFDVPFNPVFGDFFYYFPNFASPTVESGSVTDAFATYLPGQAIPFLYGTVTIAAGTVLTSPDTGNSNDANIAFDVPRAEPGRLWAVAPMLAPGVSSWSMRLVGGADLASADSRTVAAKSSLGEHGDVLLEDAHKAGPSQNHLAPSVIRTGTGYLDVLAGGDYRQNSLFGVYTAGTQLGGTQAWDETRALMPDGSGTVLGFGYEGYEATLNAQRMYFTTGGGDLLLSAQGDVRGYSETNLNGQFSSNEIGRWLWRQGGDELGQQTAWGINFGQYRLSNFSPEFAGFSGIGTLGGGDATVIAGGDAGSVSNVASALVSSSYTTNALNVVVGGSGLVDDGDRLLQTGGGTLTLEVGGRVNTGVDDQVTSYFDGGQIVNLRGDVRVGAASIGQTLENGYGVKAANDPRAVDTRMPLYRYAFTAMGLSIGDGAASLQTRGDLNLLTGQDPGRTSLRGGDTQADDGTQFGSGTTSFTLWTERSGIELFAAGGDIHQTVADLANAVYDPGRFSATAAGGTITLDNLLLAPSATGELQLLARDHLFGTASMSGGSLDNLATPLQPVWALGGMPADTSSIYASNAYTLFPNGPKVYEYFIGGGLLFGFGPDTATDLHAGDVDPIRMYAVNGDIVARTGQVRRFESGGLLNELSYTGAKPVSMRAGRDILATALILNNDADDISVIQAGRDILNTTLDIAGPGSLEVTAGRNVYQALSGLSLQGEPDSTIDSIGPIVSGDTREGASIVLTAGMGNKTPDYAAFAARYLDPANQADPDRPLADQPGKVVKTYEQEMQDWLKARFGYEGVGSEALAYFQALPQEQQAILARSIYFEELRLSGREYNDPDSRRFSSYLRGRNAIAMLLPEKDAEGRDISYEGSISFQNNAGIHTDFGGGIQVLVPGGGLTLGADGIAPPSSTGLLTQGSGNIETYTQGSVLLGLSRIMTTFGGGITSWSAEGDINAGRGAKTTVLYTPPKLTYDGYGNVALAPTVPSSGAGIATLNPIPEVAAGDVDLIAPLGTIDAGEAGIRVSGNVNLAALQVVNAANIQVKGEATGIPVTAAVNTGALTSASAAANSATQAVQEMTRNQQDAARRNLPSIISVQVLGFGESSSRIDAPRDGNTTAQRTGYDPASAFQVLGNGELTEAQQARLTAAERRRLLEPR